MEVVSTMSVLSKALVVRVEAFHRLKMYVMKTVY